MFVYWSEINKKNYEAIYAGLALYGVHWLYEIGNEMIGHVFGYPLWSASNDSTTFILLIGSAVATQRFFDTLNKVETELNKRNAAEE